MRIDPNGQIKSAYRQPVNAYQQAANSIHNDAVAKPLGLRGGTVAGSVHMDQFPPTLLDVFGPKWFETGSLSLHFINPTVDKEPVAVIVEQPPTGDAVQTAVAVERDDGLLVATGTASVGRIGAATYLEKLDLRPTDPDELRMLRGFAPGSPLMTHPGRVESDEAKARERNGLITEPLPWYVGESPWGGPVASPSMLVRMLYRPTSELVREHTGGAVGLFGATEIRHHSGPVLADTDYEVATEVVAVGQSPKTEYLWFDSVATRDGVRVATMRMQLRYMKASSSHYQ